MAILKHIKPFSFALVLLFSLVISSCRQGPGPGGKAQIKGKIYTHQWNATFATRLPLQDHYEPDHDVYIVYGDDITYGDKVSTHYDGTFVFNYLLPGTYTVYTYSKDKTGNSPTGDIVIETTVEISDRKEVIDLGDIIIEDN